MQNEREQANPQGWPVINEPVKETQTEEEENETDR